MLNELDAGDGGLSSTAFPRHDFSTLYLSGKGDTIIKKTSASHTEPLYHYIQFLPGTSRFVVHFLPNTALGFLYEVKDWLVELVSVVFEQSP